MIQYCNHTAAKLCAVCAEHNALEQAYHETSWQKARIAELEAALRLLGVIADAYDDNALDPPARKRWGKNNEHEETRNPQEIILYSGRGGKTLLTLADCLAARAVLEKK